MNEPAATEPIQLVVECYAGYRGEQEPRRLWFGERSVNVNAVLDRWLAPEHRYFKLSADDGATYIVRQDNASRLWELTFFEQRHQEG